MNSLCLLRPKSKVFEMEQRIYHNIHEIPKALQVLKFEWSHHDERTRNGVELAWKVEWVGCRPLFRLCLA